MSGLRVEPIDIDFAGWSIVDPSEANAWGVIDGDVLVVARKYREDAEQKMAEIERGSP